MSIAAFATIGAMAFGTAILVGVLGVLRPGLGGVLRGHAGLVVASATVLSGLVGSFVLSEVYHVPIPSLGWWQRMFMMSAGVFLVLAATMRDVAILPYVRVLLCAGLAVSLWHWVKQYAPMLLRWEPCSDRVPCVEVQVEVLGAVTLPVIAAMVFGAALLFLASLDDPLSGALTRT